MAVSADNPIRHSQDDVLSRTAKAQSFARHVLSLDASEGIVVGVLGAWGSGKTSFVNLARGEFNLSGIPIIDFNPWMFSGTEQLVERFFIELASQLKLRPGLADIAKSIEEYGEAFSVLTWIPILGRWLEASRGFLKVFSQLSQRRQGGVGGSHARVQSSLAKLNYPIIVILDDVDRLSSSEIRDVFRLVRLTASFPNIIYIIAFDRYRVEQALSEQGVPGRAYLEKILQVAVNLPEIPRQVINRQLLLAINDALSGIDNAGPFYEQAWPDIFMEIILPLVRNMRDVRRYVAAVWGTVHALNGQIALTDVLELEAIRTFLPDVYGQLHSTIKGLTTSSGSSYGNYREPPYLKVSIDSLIEVNSTFQEVVRSMIKRLFPAAERHIGGSNYGDDWKAQWLRERRVAHEDILSLYLEQVPGEGLQAFTNAERAFNLMADRTAFEDYLHSLDVERLEDVIASLETFEKEFKVEHVVPSTIVLLNLMPSLPERPRGMFDLGARLVVGRVIYRLLRSLGNQSDIEAAVGAILPQLTSLSAKLEPIIDVGYRENAGHKLVSESAAAEFERGWRAEVRAASSADLMRESELLRVLIAAKKDAEPDELLFEIPESPELALAIFKAAQGEIRSQGMGSRAIQRTPKLEWDVLVLLFNSEEEIKRRFEQLKVAKIDGEDELLELLERYLGGWRPKDILEG